MADAGTFLSEVSECLSRFTIALIQVGQNGTIGSYCSGVLVTLGGRNFILTAGHCIEEYERAPDRLLLGVQTAPHNLRPRFPLRTGKKLVIGASMDFGFIEVPPNLFAQIKSEKIFVPGRRLLVVDDVSADRDLFAFLGVPRQLATHSAHDVTLSNYLYCTWVAGQFGLPPSNAHPPLAGVRVVDVHVSKEGPHHLIKDGCADPVTMAATPDLGGCSGAGCWKLGRTEESWNSESVQLVGIHIGHSTTGEETFARSVLVGHHLRLLADEFADLREDIFKSWPILRDDSWACGSQPI